MFSEKHVRVFENSCTPFFGTSPGPVLLPPQPLAYGNCYLKNAYTPERLIWKKLPGKNAPTGNRITPFATRLLTDLRYLCRLDKEKE